MLAFFSSPKYSDLKKFFMSTHNIKLDKKT